MPFKWNHDDPLARALGESLRAYQALLDYWEMGERRSFANLRKSVVDSPSKKYRLRTLQEWSSRFQWQARIARATDLRRLDERRIEAEAREQAIRRLIADEQHDADLLRGKARKILTTLPVVEQRAVVDGENVVLEAASSSEYGAAARMLKLASDLGRRSLSLPAQIERQEQTGAGGGPIETSTTTLEEWRRKRDGLRLQAFDALDDFVGNPDAERDTAD